MTEPLSDILSCRLEGFEGRPEQDTMAQAVAEILRRPGHLIVEAGTGTGKSLAYLIPLADTCVREESRAVVSTYTKALQRQLVEKDLPFIQKNILPELRFALCFGSENYLCRRRLERARTQQLFDDREHFDALVRWADASENGIRQGSGGPAWSTVCRESDNCHGRDCQYTLMCFYQRAREQQRQSHILVVNHHLYFSNMSSGGRVLPPFQSVVFDEAHELEDVAADYLGLEISNLAVRHLCNSILSERGRGILKRLKWMDPSDFSNVQMMSDVLRLRSDEFFADLQERLDGPTQRIEEKALVDDSVSEHFVRLGAELEALARTAPSDEDRRDLQALQRRCDGFAVALRSILWQEMEGHVYWAEQSGRRTALHATPIDIGGMKVFSEPEAAIFTSATLSTGGNFNYIRERLGLLHADALRLDSHFDYRRQARLYVARDLPSPTTAEYERSVITRIGDILARTGGRTLVLFTSYSLLNRAADAMQARGHTVARQGEADSYQLIEEFRDGSVEALFGTYTFWQGIDVPGDALKYVVIVRLPFAVPDDPVVEARIELLQRHGRDPFMEYQVPRAAITLKQGFGRLIRSKLDTGGVAILDSRLLTRRYGTFFMESLPPARVVFEIDEMLMK